MLRYRKTGDLNELGCLSPVLLILFLVLFSLTALVSLLQIVRMVIYARTVYRKAKEKKQLVIPRRQHALMVLLCALRVVSILVWLGWLGSTLPGPALTALTVCPYLVFFWIFTFFTAQYASILYHAMLGGAEAWKKTRPIYLVLNLLIVVIMITFFSSLPNVKGLELPEYENLVELYTN